MRRLVPSCYGSLGLRDGMGAVVCPSERTTPYDAGRPVRAARPSAADPDCAAGFRAHPSCTWPRWMWSRCALRPAVSGPACAADSTAGRAKPSTTRPPLRRSRIPAWLRRWRLQQRRPEVRRAPRDWRQPRQVRSDAPSNRPGDRPAYLSRTPLCPPSAPEGTDPAY